MIKPKPLHCFPGLLYIVFYCIPGMRNKEKYVFLM